MQKENIRHLALLAAVYAVAMLIVNPTGNFPLNDDWAYAKDVWYLSQQGRLKLDDWPAMTRLTQIFWGAGWVKIFGFSHEVLRFSTILLGFVGLAALWKTLVEMGAARQLATLATLVLMLNPIYFSLSATFMTDIPFLSLFLWSCYFFVKAGRTDGVGDVALGALFALLATMVRQFGMAAPLAFAVMWLWKHKISLRNLLVAGLPLAISVAAYLIFTKWYEATQGLPEAYGSLDKLLKRFGGKGYYEEVGRRIGLLLIFLGLFLSPITVPLLRQQIKSTNKKLLGWTIGITAMLALSYFLGWKKYPLGNVIYNLGIGPKVLKDGTFFINVFPMLPDFWLNLVRGIGATLGVVFLLIFIPSTVRGFKNAGSQRVQSIFIWAFLLAYLGFLFTELYFIDRYHMVLVPFVLVVLVQSSGVVFTKKHWLLASAIFVFTAGFTLTGTHDYFSWNRARWQAIDYLTKEKGLKSNQIDGGFEYNGWDKPGPFGSRMGISWWWVEREDYIVTFGPMDGFTKEKGYPYQRWLPPGVDSVYVLKHN